MRYNTRGNAEAIKEELTCLVDHAALDTMADAERAEDPLVFFRRHGRHDTQSKESDTQSGESDAKSGENNTQSRGMMWGTLFTVLTVVGVIIIGCCSCARTD